MATIYASDLGQTPLVVATPSNDKVGMLGHIEFEHLDNSGDIKGYYQTDNFVTDSGSACTASLLFDRGTDVHACDTTGTLVNEFINIRLGNVQPLADDPADIILDGDMGGVKTATSVGFTQTASTGQTVATIATPTPFDFVTGNATLNVFQAGLFDETSGGNPFAIQNTTSGDANPGIDVNDGDQLTVTWTITVG